jgi:ketosteroid isomerase-like protein
VSTHSAQGLLIPSDKIQVLKDGLEAFSSGDLERILEITHPDFVGVVPPELSAEPDTYRGHDGITRYFESFWDVLDEIRFEPERLWDAGEDVVVAWTRVTGRGRQTAILVEQRNAQVWTVRDGQLRSVVTYASLADALRAAGVQEQPEQPAP